MMNREQVKQTAIAMVQQAGLINLSRRDLCDRAGIPDGSFPHVMGCNFADFVNELKAEGHDGATYPVSKSRANPGLRKDQILNVAIGLAKEQGYHKITRDGVADAAGVSMGLVTRYFGTMKQLKKAVMRAAVKQAIPEIVAQGLANGDDHAKKAPAELKAQAATLLANF
jgi:DNA-binding transcriptional regulator YbjK